MELSFFFPFLKCTIPYSWTLNQNTTPPNAIESRYFVIKINKGQIHIN